MAKLYENKKIYGPYLAKDSRLRIIVVENDRKTTVSYPKYLMELSLNRYLTKTETVQHLDGNPLNNDLSNLIVLGKSEHAKMDAKRVNDVVLTCQWCKKEFLVKGSFIHNRLRKDRHSNSFCSKECSGQYGKSIQLGFPKLNKIEIERIYRIERDDKMLSTKKKIIKEISPNEGDTTGKTNP